MQTAIGIRASTAKNNPPPMVVPRINIDFNPETEDINNRLSACTCTMTMKNYLNLNYITYM